MKTIYSLVLFLLLATGAFAFSPVIWNSDNNTVIGVYNYFDPTYEADSRIVLEGVNLDTGAQQTSAYNYATGQLSLMVRFPSDSNRLSLVTIDCVSWKLIGNVKLDPTIPWGGLQYDQTNGASNLVVVGSSGSTLIVARVNPVNGDVNVINKLQGTLLSTVLVAKTKQFFITSYQSGVGTSVNELSIDNGNVITTFQPTVSGVPEGYKFVSGPYLTTFVPKYNAILSLINFESDSKVFANFASLVPSQKGFVLSKMKSDAESNNIAMVADQDGYQNLYAIAKMKGSYYFCVYDISQGILFKSQTIKTPVLAMF